MKENLPNIRFYFASFILLSSIACAASRERGDSDASDSEASVYEGDAMVHREGGSRTENGNGDTGTSSGEDATTTIEDSHVGSGGSGFSTDSGSSTDTAAQPPIREIRPEWEPPFDLAEPGWQSSVEPLCPSVYGQRAGYSVWSNDEGVYVVVAKDCNPMARTGCNIEERGIELIFNDGNGWQTLFRPEQVYASNYNDLELTGFPDGRAAVYGGVTEEFCPITFVNSDSSTCFDSVDTMVLDLFVVNNDLAYAVLLDRILIYNDTEWKTWSSLSSDISDINSIWAFDHTIIAAGYAQSVLISNNGSSLAPLSGVPAGDYTAIWGFSEDDIWFGNTAGQLVHYDGANWDIIETGSQEQLSGGIIGLWGHEGKIFFHTYTELGLWDGNAVQWLLPRMEDRITITDLWGNSLSEVFVTVEDREYLEYNCGGDTFILWYDGKDFHQM